MSTQNPQANSQLHSNIHQSHGSHGQDLKPDHGSFSSYMTGFVLSVILTAIPFWLVMGDVLISKLMTAIIVMGIGALQIVVHMVYFLHMNPRSEGGWTIMALIFTLIIVGIALSGSLWVMHHLNVNMMPMTHEMMKVMP